MVEDIRVLVVDRGAGLANGLICGLPGDGVSVLGPVADATAALRALKLEPINLVLVDLDRPDDDGVEIVRRIREVAERTRVIGVTVQRGP
ncbi:MAG: response regulator, partial [Actinomycetota bacterium]